MGGRLASAAGTFAIRGHLSIPARFFSYNDSNVISHKNTSFAVFIFNPAASSSGRPISLSPVAAVIVF
jgi:hypothetical protein